MSNEVIIYGASDDLVEFDGAIQEEFNAYGEWVGRLTSPAGDSLIIRVEFSVPGAESDWRIQVENTATYPSWPMRFAERHGYEGDPALIIDIPSGTTITELSNA